MSATSNSGDRPWVLIPGLGTDHRLFANILDRLPEHQVLIFETPDPHEDIHQYARRLARQIRCEPPFVLAGTSFGGMLASLLCPRLDPLALVLMSSTDDPAGLGQAVRAFEWLSRVLPDTYAQWVRRLGRRSAGWLEPIPPDRAADFQAMLSDSDLTLVRRSARMIMNWRTPAGVTCPKFHVHGDRDLLIPIDKLRPTHRVAGAGHLLNLTHPNELRVFVCEVQQRLRE